jgi:hypothetical protein
MCCLNGEPARCDNHQSASGGKIEACFHASGGFENEDFAIAAEGFGDGAVLAHPVNDLPHFPTFDMLRDGITLYLKIDKHKTLHLAFSLRLPVAVVDMKLTVFLLK